MIYLKGKGQSQGRMAKDKFGKASRVQNVKNLAFHIKELRIVPLGTKEPQKDSQTRNSIIYTFILK